jgi:hypothetical protein
MMLRRALASVGSRRAFSAAAVSPRFTIAQNIVALSQITNAADESAIAAARSSKALDTSKLPAELQGFESYLAAGALASEAGFKADSSSWHNQKGWDFIWTEATRSNTWPFLVGVL